jgi:photosystem II stability/assembly factor-like uncharacterized protein
MRCMTLLAARLDFVGRSLLSLALSVPIALQSADAQTDKWTPRGFANEEINTLAIDHKNPSTLYVTTNNGAFKSVDGGGSWTALQPDSANRPNDALVIDPSDPSILYGLRRNIDGGVLSESADAGQSWSKIETNLNPVAFPLLSGKSSLAIDPQASSKLYLIGPDLWVSEDRGRQWQRLASQESPALTLAIDPKQSSILYLGTGNQDARKSTDGGKNWRTLAVLRQADSFSVFSIAIDPEDSSVLYAATPNGVHKSVDAGQRWQEINNGLPIGQWGRGGEVVAIDMSKPSTIYASVGGRVYVSANRGESWAEAGTGLPENGVMKRLVLDPRSSTLYAAGTRGLWTLPR